MPEDSGSRRFFLFPTGPGEEIPLTVPGVPEPVVRGWLDGKQSYLVVDAVGPRKRCVAWDAARSTVCEVCPPGIGSPYRTYVSPDGKKVLTAGPDGRFTVYPVEGGTPLEVQGIGDNEVPTGWRSDNTSVFLRPHEVRTARIPITILDIATGKRSLWKELVPTRPLDSPGDLHLHVTTDGRAYAYNYSMLQSDLYVAEGLR